MLTKEKVEQLDFTKLDGLLPVVVTDQENGQVLMVGFMNEEALLKTLEEKKVTFFSRSKNRLWTKGESSGNYLTVVNIVADCDSDTLLIKAVPQGPTCHTGNYSCFNVQRFPGISFLQYLEDLIYKRKAEMPEGSYTTKLFTKGHNKIIQKVGEEAVEVVIAAKNRDRNEIINESSDLMFHLLVMLAEQDIHLEEIVSNLEQRHK